MDLRHLHYFLAVAEALDVSRAARQLRLAAAGRALVERARRVLNEAEALRQHAQ